jgi:hypothetical protein
MFWGLTINEWLTLAAIVVAPLVALQVSQRLERQRAKRDRRLIIFRALMANRSSALAPDHVQALNMIDIEFAGKDRKSRAVVSAWQEYVAHLNEGFGPVTEVWISRRQNLFIDLLHSMAQSLGYDFDKAHIRRTSYFPKGYGDLERDQLALRKGLLDVLQGKAALPIFVANEMPSPGPPAQTELPLGEAAPPALPPDTANAQ